LVGLADADIHTAQGVEKELNRIYRRETIISPKKKNSFFGVVDYIPDNNKELSFYYFLNMVSFLEFISAAAAGYSVSLSLSRLVFFERGVKRSIYYTPSEKIKKKNRVTLPSSKKMCRHRILKGQGSQNEYLNI
jgi:hypothetical protein